MELGLVGKTFPFFFKHPRTHPPPFFLPCYCPATSFPAEPVLQPSPWPAMVLAAAAAAVAVAVAAAQGQAGGGPASCPCLTSGIACSGQGSEGVAAVRDR